MVADQIPGLRYEGLSFAVVLEQGPQRSEGPRPQACRADTTGRRGRQTKRCRQMPAEPLRPSWLDRFSGVGFLANQIQQPRYSSCIWSGPQPTDRLRHSDPSSGATGFTASVRYRLLRSNQGHGFRDHGTAAALRSLSIEGWPSPVSRPTFIIIRRSVEIKDLRQTARRLQAA